MPKSSGFGANNGTIIYGDDGLLNVVDTKTLERKLTLVGDKVWITDLEVSKQGFIAMGGSEKLIRLYDSSSGQSMGILSGHHEGVSDLAFNSAGTLLYSVGLDGDLKVWDIASQTCLEVVQAAPLMQE